MRKYRVKHDFMIETEHISIMFNTNSRWIYLGYSNNYIRLNKNEIFIDIPKDTFERNFVEVKEQK